MINVENQRPMTVGMCIEEASECINNNLTQYELLRAVQVLAKDAYYTRYLTNSIFNAFTTISKAAFYNGVLYLLDKYKESEMTEDNARRAKLIIEQYQVSNTNDGPLFKETMNFIAKERYNFKSPFYVGLKQFMMIRGNLNDLYWIAIAFDKLIRVYYSLMSLSQGSLSIWIELLNEGEESLSGGYSTPIEINPNKQNYWRHKKSIHTIENRIVHMYKSSDIGFLKRKLILHYLRCYNFDIGHYSFVKDDIKKISIWELFKACKYMSEQFPHY